MKKIIEISYKHFERFDLASMSFGGFRPAIFKSSDSSRGFGIRIRTGRGWRGDTQSENWDYFELDSTKLIISSPRGMAKQYNKKCRVTDIEVGVEEYKEKSI